MTPAVPLLTASEVRGTLMRLEAELYEEAIPYDGTAARLVSITDAVAQIIAFHSGRLPKQAAYLLANAVQATRCRDFLSARALILEALEVVPMCRLPKGVQQRHTPTKNHLASPSW